MSRLRWEDDDESGIFFLVRDGDTVRRVPGDTVEGKMRKFLIAARAVGRVIRDIIL